MSDLISRQEAIDALNNVLAEYVPILIGRTEEIPLRCAAEINKLQDAVVHCKDCKYYPVTSLVSEDVIYSSYPFCGYMLGNGYCSYGERKR